MSKWRTFTETRDFVHTLKLTGEKTWRGYCKSDNKPNDIPSSPNTIYKDEWISWGNWVGTSNIATRDKQFRSFTEARDFVHTLNLKNSKDWKNYCKSGNKPNNIPSNPHRTYENEWISCGDWLGTGNIRNRDKQFLPFIEARNFVNTLNLKNSKDWRDYYKSGKKPNNIPSSPNKTYDNEWKGIGDWLGTGNINNADKQFCSFTEAKNFVHTLKLTGEKAWRDYSKSEKKPNKIPSHPDRTYKDEWISWGDWLDTGRITIFNKECCKFIETRNFVRKLKLKSQKDWEIYSKSGNKPNDIPICPNVVYKDEWISWGDWLGTGNISSKDKQFRPFPEARDYIHTLKLSGKKAWYDYCKSGNKPDNIPSNPNATYKDEWISYGDWLGTGRISSKLEHHIKCQKFIEAINSIKDNLDWLPLAAWWYVLLQSGVEPTNRRIRLLKYNQCGKLSLEKLIEAVIDNKHIDEDEGDLFQKFKKPDSVKILNLLKSPIFAGMDSEAIAAIMAELKSQLWECIYNDEDNEIRKLKEMALKDIV